MKKMMNEDVPYEYQMKPILANYDKLVSENQKLKNRIAELEKTLEKERSEKALKADTEFNNLKSSNKNRGDKLEWIQKTLEDYLVSLGIELPEYRTVTKIVKMIVKI